MNKLVIIFNSDDEVLNIDSCLIFNNEIDATEYLSSKELENIKIEPNNNLFSFKTKAGWSGNGRVIWAKQK